eukprot:TRINITY_DN9653_c0_g1_i9.p1 TRINITY_DN9653_c0_g1~~TRINITY_DN9653_c0_g1_i9.p1  ORF type:complete len:297 (+),score=57.94 TRINITY_DN9653_c0_g1_i9:74-964(+)
MCIRDRRRVHGKILTAMQDSVLRQKVKKQIRRLLTTFNTQTPIIIKRSSSRTISPKRCLPINKKQGSLSKVRVKRNKYAATTETVEQILRKHKDRVNNAQIPSSLGYLNSLSATTQTVKGCSKNSSYYTLDRDDATNADYFNLNKDVRDFARNFDLVLQIRENTIRQANSLLPQAKAKSREKKLETREGLNKAMLKTSVVKFPKLVKKESEQITHNGSFRMAMRRTKKAEEKHPFNRKVSRFLRLMNTHSNFIKTISDKAISTYSESISKIEDSLAKGRESNPFEAQENTREKSAF